MVEPLMFFSVRSISSFSRCRSEDFAVACCISWLYLSIVVLAAFWLALISSMRCLTVASCAAFRLYSSDCGFIPAN